MKDYKRLTKWSELGTLHVFDINGKEIPLCDVSPIDTDNLAGRLADLEDKIESGEIDYVADRDKEIDRLTAERDIMKAALDNLIFYCTNDKKFMCEAVSEKCPRRLNGTFLCGGDECGKIMLDFYIEEAKRGLGYEITEERK